MAPPNRLQNNQNQSTQSKQINMIKLFSNHKYNTFPPSQFSATTPMTPQQARVEAQNLLRGGLSQAALDTLDLLSVAGVLPIHRLLVRGRTLRKYRQRQLLDRLPFTTKQLQETFAEYGLQAPDALTLYTLGPVGIEIVRERHGVQPPTGYLAYTIERVMHDVVVNEIVLTIADQAMQNGWQSALASKYEATLYSADRSMALLEPDGMLRIQRGEEEHVYLFEYHNEDKATRARSKVARYQAAFDSGLWRDQWEVETFPLVLAVFRRPVIGNGYAEALAEIKAQVQFYGRTLENALDEGFSAWYHFNQKVRVGVFPWYV
jgi:acyl-coenzyme A thioesterase PaaI-like protein